jgi:hypothetical protein
MSTEIFRKYIDLINEAEGSLREFAPGGSEGNGPYAYGIALKEMAKLYAKGEFDIDLGSTSSEQNESDAIDIDRVAEAFLNQGMEAGRDAYKMLDDILQDDMDEYLGEQGFNVDNDIHAEYQKDVERYRNSAQGQAAAQAQQEKDAEWEKGAAERDANLVVISAVDSKTQRPEFNRTEFDQRQVPAGQLRAKIEASIAELQKDFATYRKPGEGEKIIKVTIGGKPVEF